MDTIKDLGEFGFIEKIKTIFEQPDNVIGIGDDCAVIPMLDTNMLVTIDTLIENVHFFSNHPMDKLAIKALNVNISDIIACGGVPKWAFLSISLNPMMQISKLDIFLNQLHKQCENHKIYLIGGNTTKDDKLSINITLIGEAQKPILRSGAKPGQDVFVTGKIGCSACGFWALKNETKAHSKCLERFLSPQARTDLIAQIKPYATCMIDISDGLLQDANQVCRASKVGMEIFLEQVKFCECDNLNMIDKITFGEDYELLFCAERRYREHILAIGDVSLIGYTNDSQKLTIYHNGYIVKPYKYGFTHF